MTIPFESNCRYGLMTEDGKIIIPAIYKNVSPLYDTLFVVTNFKNRKGVISASGKMIIPLRFEIITVNFMSFENRIEAVPEIVASNNFRDFYYDLKGRQLTPKKGAKPFEGFCGNSDGEPQLDKIFSINDKYGLTHKEQVTAEAVYDTLISVSWGTDYFIAKRGNQYGVLSLYGDTIYHFGNYRFYYDQKVSGLIIVDKLTNLKGLYTNTYLGICNLPCIYENISSRIGNQYFLVKEVRQCEYYYDFVTKRKFRK